ncbi:hypothetical protein [Hoeflea alexandrii]|uniref:hypothetical protein n=1 Tax=Hoeflea alexandrii TaxID=288436 RepID=UPI0022B07E6F|nr:hypothetical protein [Hoeflea alexandrii]MCZ4291692.1 hypothetical protein [Hoeflea alexandrii]
MNTSRLHKADEISAPINVIGEKLEDALAQIEQRFLDGGTVLVSVLDVFTGLLKSLEDITNALREDEAEQATRELMRTGELIAALPAQQLARRERFESIMRYGKSLASEVLVMEDTLRYLRAFAMTAKITGAGIADFAGFAEEIVERIQFATREVQAFAECIHSLQHMVHSAHAGGEVLAAHEHAIPAIAQDLVRNANAIQTQRKTLADIADQVKDLALKVQGRLASTLSSLQIGDVTRQRIEHCQAAFVISNDYLSRDEAANLSPEDRDRIRMLITRLVRDQLAAIAAEFQVQCGTIVKNIGAFSNDATLLIQLQQSMLPARADTSERSSMGLVQNSLELARDAVAGIEQSAGEAARLSGSAGDMVKGLVESVRTIQLVRTDIQYMALNTYLRCTQLGEESRAINVVTNELRSFSAKLDEVTDRALDDLNQLNQQAIALSHGQTGNDTDGGPDLVGRIEIALSHVTQADQTLEAQVDNLCSRGQDVTIKVAAATAGLDFHQDVSAILGDCRSLAAGALTYEPHCDGLEDVLDGLSADIFRTYTMKSERDVHAAIFGWPTASEAKTEPTLAPEVSDDDLFDDALF